MINPTIHRKVVGQIHLTTIVYDKEVFNLIIQKLISSKIFKSTSPQVINHRADVSKKSPCNCNDILTYIGKQFRLETERFAQVFVPLLIVDTNSKKRQHLLCELNFIHDNLLKSRKDFFVDDVQQNYLLKGYSRGFKGKKHYESDCVFNLNEVLSFKQNDDKKHYRDISKRNKEDCHKENHIVLLKVLRKLLANDLLPLSSKSLPIDSLRLQKVFDICFEHRLPDDMTVCIINSLRKVQPCSNESNNCTANNKNLPRRKTNKENLKDLSFSDSSENSLIYVTNNSARQTPDLETPQQKNISNNSRGPSMRRSSQIQRRPNSNVSRPQSSVRTSFNPRKSSNWDNMRYYEPVSLKVPSQPQMASFHSKPSNSYLSNFPKSKNVKFAPERPQSRRINMRPAYQGNNLGPAETDETPYEVVIDDECHDLENVEAITVRNSDGNSRVYVECDAPNNYSRFNESYREPSFKPPSELSNFRRNSKKVTFVNNDVDEFSKCGSTALTRAVLGQEANSMDSLLSILNTKVQKDGESQCMKLSMKAEHIIRKPECAAGQVYLEEQDGCLTVSSQVQAKWENCICNEDEEFMFNDPQLKSQYTKMPQNSETGFRYLDKSMTSNPNSEMNVKSTPKPNLTYQEISNLCDKAIQTEKFLFLETDNERIVISPNFLQNRDKGSVRFPSSKDISQFSNMATPSNNCIEPEHYICYDQLGNSYYCEDPNSRIISESDPRYLDQRNVQPMQPTYIDPVQQNINGILQNNIYRDPPRSSDIQSVGNYYKEHRLLKNDLKPIYNYSMHEVPNFIKQKYPFVPNPNQVPLYNVVEHQPAAVVQNTNHSAMETNYNSQRGCIYENTNKQRIIRGNASLIHNQSNYSSSASRLMLARPLSSPEEFIYVESSRLSPIIDVHVGFRGSPTNTFEKKSETNKNRVTNRDISLCQYHKSGGSIERNNSNIRSRKEKINTCDRCSHWLDPLELLYDESSSSCDLCSTRNDINPISKKYLLNSFTFRKPNAKYESEPIKLIKNCECSNNWTISVIPSLSPSKMIGQTDSDRKVYSTTRNNMEKSWKTYPKKTKEKSLQCYKNDQISPFPCLEEIVTKINSKAFYNDCLKILRLNKNSLKNKSCHSRKKNLQKKTIRNTKKNSDIKVKMTKSNLDLNWHNCSKEGGGWPEVEVDCGPNIPYGGDIVESSFENYFIS